ncbi:hypothetical protein B0H11DRAFT_1973302 [Mycena galericulata]|nr:hypothetical protein B0H11DRAFT_1973302 [Mycena galericulata]
MGSGPSTAQPRQRYNAPPGRPPLLGPPPPEYAPTGGQSHEVSEQNATEYEYEVADAFCRRNPSIMPATIFSPDHRNLPNEQWGLVSMNSVTGLTVGSSRSGMADPGNISLRIDQMEEPQAWRGESNHQSELVMRDPSTRAAHFLNRGDTCFTSNLPIIAGQYSITSKRGVYFEITIRELRGPGTIALGSESSYFILGTQSHCLTGMQCLPYPPNRLPGWHRKSAALHFDDGRIYFDDSTGGKDYLSNIPDGKRRRQINEHDTVGCGYEFNHGVGYLFYTHNGELLPIAFHAIFDARKDEQEVDVFAAVGVTDGSCRFDVNFGVERFKWTGPTHSRCEWNLDEWTVRGLFNQLGRDEPPQYGT